MDNNAARRADEQTRAGHEHRHYPAEQLVCGAWGGHPIAAGRPAPAACQGCGRQELFESADLLQQQSTQLSNQSNNNPAWKGRDADEQVKTSTAGSGGAGGPGSGGPASTPGSRTPVPGLGQQ